MYVRGGDAIPWGTPELPLCPGCVPSDLQRSWRKYRDCHWCGRRRYYGCASQLPRNYCCYECLRLAKNARRRKPRRTIYMVCVGCEETFTAQRRDAEYCSSACRQRAYRGRVSRR